MSDEPIAFNQPYVTGAELGYIEEAIASGHLAGNGPFTKRGQRLLEERYGLPHVLLTHSCTGAMELAGLVLDLGPGDEVIVPSYTFATTASAFARTGARIVFAEIDPATMNIDPADVANKVTGRTRVIVPVHYGGIGAPMAELAELTDGTDIALVEDAAQGLEARIGEEWLGTIGRLGAFSFHETKNVHSGLGGALFINDASLFDRAEDIWERGTDRAKLFKGVVDKYTWVEMGSSFYPTELAAAFLYAQLESIEQNQKERQAIYATYDELLRPVAAAGAFALPIIPEERHLNAHSFFLIANSQTDADRMREGLAAGGISAYIGYVPLHSSPMGQRLGYAADDLPVTEEYAARVLRLPLHNSMTPDDAARVAHAIAELTR